VNGTAGIIVAPGGHLFTVMVFMVKREKIVKIDVVTLIRKIAMPELAGL
jgi:hypothetical protein